MIAGITAESGAEMTMAEGMKGDEFNLDPIPVSDGRIAIHINPTRMVLFPFFVGVPSTETELSPQLCATPRESGPLTSVEEMPKRDYPWWWIPSSIPVSPGGDRICLVCRQTPGPIIWGKSGGPCFRTILAREWRQQAGAPPLEPPDVVD